MKPLLVLRQVPHEGLGILEELLPRAGLVYSYIEMYDRPPRHFHPEQLCGLIVLGGPMNVDETDRHPFLATEVEWIRRAIDEGLPVLGICLGSQLLAKALGARVRANGVKEIGWYPIELTDEAAEDPLFSACPSRPTVFQWHGDTFDLPAGAVQLARSEQCENQAFRYGNAAYGLQFHMEVTAPMIDAWLAEPDNACEVGGLDYIDPAEIQRRTPQEVPAMRELAETVFGPFIELCRKRCA